MALAFVLALAGAAYATHFPSTNPDESVRLHTPNDPEFDKCEPDGAPQTCTAVFDQEFERFGFAPKATENTATYKNPSDPHVARLMGQNTLAGRTPIGQVRSEEHTSE